MALRPTPKRNSVDYQKLDDLQKEIFGSEKSEKEEKKTTSRNESTNGEVFEQDGSEVKTRSGYSDTDKSSISKTNSKITINKAERKNSPGVKSTKQGSATPTSAENDYSIGEHLGDLEKIAAHIVSTKAGQGRNTTRPFSLPRTLIIDTTRLKSKFRTIDEQFTQNVIIDFLLREALAAVTPENYKDLRTAAFESVKRAEETTRRSLTVTEDVIYQMSELKAGINLETGRKYSNDEIFSTLLAIGVSWLYRNEVLT
ncbi:MAG TPA: hypothetical protein VK308_00830 [Pyrinomonadaceae bacterium]|nr:hypothetical protein [Pyrinomonadaceae bacterium]